MSSMSQKKHKKTTNQKATKTPKTLLSVLRQLHNIYPNQNSTLQKAPVRAKSLLSRWRMSRALFRSWRFTYIDDHRPLEILTGHVGPLRFGGNRGTDVLHMEKPLRGGKKHLRWVGRTRWNNVSLRWIWLQSALWQDGMEWDTLRSILFVQLYRFILIISGSVYV